MRGINKNMFNQEHYIPILKWKAAERRALNELVARLDAEKKKLVSPLIQLVMPSPKTPKNPSQTKTREEQLVEVVGSLRTKLQTIPEEIAKEWGADPMFIDVSLLYTPELRAESMNQILTVGETLGASLIPVVNLSSDEEVGKVSCSLAKKYGHGLCLRLVRSDFKDMPDLMKRLDSFLSSCSVPVDKIDLLVDLKEDENNEYPVILSLCQQIPNLTAWRTFIFASGAFPVDLNGCKVGEKNPLPRSDWKNWSQQRNAKLKRHPSFADYTIQHPIYKESTQFFAPSASIRYTLNDEWIVMRGQRGKSQQYLANARILSELPEYKKFGENFSYGDAQIKSRGKDLSSKQTGNATTWLVIGINHHLACVISQISTLS